MNSQFVERLCSKRRAEILDALYEMGSITDNQPTSFEKSKLLELLQHSDADIREQAINVASIHWRIEDSYPVLISMLNGSERDQSVLTTVCAAIGTMVLYGKGSPEEVSKLLSQAVLNENLDPQLRGTAYLSLCRINRRISVADFAMSPRDIEELDYDFEWTKSFLYVRRLD